MKVFVSAVVAALLLAPLACAQDKVVHLQGDIEQCHLVQEPIKRRPRIIGVCTNPHWIVVVHDDTLSGAWIAACLRT